MSHVSAGIKIGKSLAQKLNSCPGIKTILRVMSQEEEEHPQIGISFAEIKRRLQTDEPLTGEFRYLYISGIIVRVKGKYYKEQLWIIKPTLAWSIRNYLNQTGVYAA